MTRVLIVTTNYPRWEGDPHSPWLLALMARLREQGYQFDALAPSFEGLGDHVIDGVQVYRFRYAPARWETLTHEEGAPNKIRKQPLYLLLLPFYLLAGAWAAWRLGRRERYDIIHVHWPVPQGVFGWLAVVAAKDLGGLRRPPRSRSRRVDSTPPSPSARRPRLVATFYGADLVMAQRFPFLKPFVRWFARRCDDLAAISSYTARELTAITGRAPRVIPYGIELPPERDWPATPGRVLTVGRLIARKGHIYLIRAMAHLRDLPDAHLVIVGEGHERAALEAEIERLGLEDRVTLTGRVSDEELEAYYQSCQVFALPAIVDEAGDTEMLGMVSLEAMRYCKPVIASNVGGVPDIVVDGESGVLVPQKDPEALAAAIRRVLTDPDLARRLGHGGYRFARAHFSWESVAQATRAMYGEGEIKRS